MSKRIVKIKGKYYDLKSPNQSFIKLATDLKKAGISNFYFMLEIKDISLVGVDPYQSDKDGHTTLSRDMIKRIMIECERNPWYYLREVCRIPENGVRTGVPYKANRGNIAQAWCILNGIDSWLCLTRQQGKTVSALAFQAWIYSFGTSNSTFIFINKDLENAKENLRRIAAQIDLLPEYLRFEYIMEEDGHVTKAKKNATSLEHPVTKNKIVVKSKATNYPSALSLARGLTAPLLHFDEPEFTNEIGTIVKNSVSTFQTAASNAKKNKSMYARIFTCTPGDLDTPQGLQAQELLENVVEWKESMYDWSNERIHDYIFNSEDSNHIVYIEYDYHQIGLTEEWFRNIAAEINDPLVVRREILLQRLKGSSLSPYPREDIDTIIDICKKPIGEIVLKDFYYLKYYEELQKNTPYIVGVDCSTGTVGDNNAITVINPYTMEPAAELECNYIGETMFEALLIELVQKVLPKAILCIERNSVGDGIIDHLMYSAIGDRLYFDKARDLQQEEMKEYETEESMLKHNAKRKTYYGVYTEGHSRETMFKILARHVAEYKDKFITQNITRDLSRLIKTSSGKIVAQSGFHDDSIMSYLIGMYVFYHGNNLELFGFERGSDVEIDPNKGLTRPELVYQQNIPESAKNDIASTIKKELNNDNYEDLFREAIAEAQNEAKKLYEAGFAHNETLDNTADHILNDIDYGTGSLDLSLFNSLNGF